MTSAVVRDQLLDHCRDAVQIAYRMNVAGVPWGFSVGSSPAEGSSGIKLASSPGSRHHPPMLVSRPLRTLAFSAAGRVPVRTRVPTRVAAA